MISIVVMYLTFGMDMFMMQNPKIMTQLGIPDTEHDSYGNDKNFTGWRILDEESNDVQLDNFLYPYFIYNISGQEIKQAPVKCKSLNNIDPQFDYSLYLKRLELYEWYCLDLTGEQFNILNIWKSQISYSLKIFYCPDGDVTSPSCTPYNKLYDELVTKTKKLSLVVPSYMYDYKNSRLPFIIKYNTFSRPIDLQAIKSQDLIFRRVNVNTDFGWLAEEWMNQSYITLISYMMDFWKSFPKDLYLVEKSSLYCKLYS